MNVGRNTRMCAFVDLYYGVEVMEWWNWRWWVKVCKYPKWMEGIKDLFLGHRHLKWTWMRKGLSFEHKGPKWMWMRKG